MSTTAARPEFAFDGGALCLDFVNTLGDRPRGQHERLRTYDELLAFAAQAGVLPDRELPARRRRAARQGSAASRAFSRALALREALYRIFAARAEDRSPARRDLDLLNAALREALPHQRLTARGEVLGWDWDGREDFAFPLWPIARSAAELLTSPDCVRVHECASDVCSWLFIDRSPAGRRRWCDMKTCGNRAKARRFYRRQRKAGARGA